MNVYQKPYLSSQDQVSLLLERGMEISDPKRAEECLSRIGYYRLSAYWYPFRKTRPPAKGEPNNKPIVISQFRDGTKFSDCIDLYVFDKKLRLHTLDALERIEIALRTDIALLLGHHHPEAHRHAPLLHGNFTKKIRNHGTTDHEKWLAKMDELTNSSKEEFAKHFKRKYPESYMPIWIAVELWDYGMLSHFFAGMRITDQNKIAHMYGLSSGKTLESWIRYLNVTRNLCAHHSRIWNKPLVITPAPCTAGEFPEFESLTRKNGSRYYATALIIQFLLNKVNPSSSWKERLAKLMDELPTNEIINISQAGFPNKWADQPFWKK